MSAALAVECPCCGRLDLTGWLARKGVRIGPALAASLETIIRTAPATLEQTHLSGSTLRFRLRKKGLPPARRWLGLAQSIVAVRALHANPARSVLWIALDLGYGDHSGLTHLLRRNIGVLPSKARAGLSTEEMFEAWWERSALRATF